MNKISPPKVPHGLSPEEEQHFLLQHGCAHNLRHTAAASYLLALTQSTLGGGMPSESYGIYIEKLLTDAGDPTDPIERMMVEQIAMAHHSIGRLYVKAASSNDLERTKVLGEGATKMLAEFRRLAVALKKYREPTVPNNVMLVNQQNVAHNQQVALVNDDLAVKQEAFQPKTTHKKTSTTEQGSNGAIEHVAQEQFAFPESQACGSRTAQPVEAQWDQ